MALILCLQSMWYKCIFIGLLLVAGSDAQHKVFTYTGNRFTFRLYVTRNIFSDKYEYICGVDSIMITDKTTGALQTLICENNGYNCHDTDRPFFKVEDMNFDGIEDIRIRQFIPAGPDVPYYYWLYNAKTKKFEPNKQLESITSPVFNAVKKNIISEQRTSVAEYVTTTYEFVDDKPVKTEEVNKKYGDDDYVTITIKKRKNGHLITVSKSREQAGGN